MIRLHANAEHSALAHGISAARHIANFRCGEDQILVAHDLRERGSDFWNNRALKFFQIRLGSCIVEDVFAEFAHRQAFDRLEGVAVECVEYQAADFVLVRINQRLLDNFVECQIGKMAFRSDAFTFGACSDSSQVVPGLLLIRLGEYFAEIGEHKTLRHKGAGRERNSASQSKSSINGRAIKVPLSSAYASRAAGIRRNM